MSRVKSRHAVGGRVKSRHAVGGRVKCKRTRLFTRQDLLGHKDVTTTQIYTHVMAKPGLGVRSPLDMG